MTSAPHPGPTAQRRSRFWLWLGLELGALAVLGLVAWLVVSLAVAPGSPRFTNADLPRSLSSDDTLAEISPGGHDARESRLVTLADAVGAVQDSWGTYGSEEADEEHCTFSYATLPVLGDEGEGTALWSRPVVEIGHDWKPEETSTVVVQAARVFADSRAAEAYQRELARAVSGCAAYSARPPTGDAQVLPARTVVTGVDAEQLSWEEEWRLDAGGTDTYWVTDLRRDNLVLRTSYYSSEGDTIERADWDALVRAVDDEFARLRPAG